MSRALVLGGGGVVGIAWETGFLEGCREEGVELSEAELVIGTSAGAITGARLLCDVSVEQAQQAALGVTGPTAAGLPTEAVAEIFRTWASMTGADPRAARQIGALAGQAQGDGSAYAALVGAGLPGWPASTELRIAAVDIETGERVVFAGDSQVSLASALGASAAVPGVFPPVAINGRRYMDGQVHSATNADLALDPAFDTVVVAAPTNEVTGRRLGVLAERCLEQECDQLRAAGKRVVQCLPRDADREAFGKGLMDGAAFASARSAGHAQGKALARSELKSLW